MRPIVIFTGLAASIACLAAPATARIPAAERPYTARYDATRDRYCLRLFADGRAADPRPNVNGTRCRSRAAWAREGVEIAHRGRSAEVAAR